MNLIDRAKNITLKPKEEWGVIAAEEPNVGGIITGYVLPLALIPAVATFIGTGLMGVRSLTLGIGMGIVSFIATLIGVFFSATIINMLAPTFQSEKNTGRAVQLVAYAYTPVWLAGILNIIPFLGMLVAVAGLYAIYVFYLGVPFTMKTPEDKVIPYIVVSVIVMVVIYMVIAAILGIILLSIVGLGAASVMGGFN